VANFSPKYLTLCGVPLKPWQIRMPIELPGKKKDSAPGITIAAVIFPSPLI
jgi:hypothetical protein